MLLFRPVGLRELELIAAANNAEFPPRLSHQPIFYPVLSQEYATQIARDWNTKDEASSFCGFVTQFSVRDEVAGRYPVKVVGSRDHEELWVPAAELGEFNEALEGPVSVAQCFYGAAFNGEVHPASNLPKHLHGRVVVTAQQAAAVDPP